MSDFHSHFSKKDVGEKRGKNKCFKLHSPTPNTPKLNKQVLREIWTTEPCSSSSGKSKNPLGKNWSPSTSYCGIMMFSQSE